MDAITELIIKGVLASQELKDQIKAMIPQGDEAAVLAIMEKEIKENFNPQMKAGWDNSAKKIEERLQAFREDFGKTVMPQLLKNCEEKIDIALKMMPKGGSGKIEVKDFRSVPPVSYELDHQHEKFEDLVKLVTSHIPVYIYGPTGSGKTFATRIIAEQVLKIPFYRKVMTSQASESYLMGYSDATGKYVEGIAFKAFTEGGLLLIDELDNGNSNINTCIKMIWDLDECYFPCVGNKKKHENFYLIANANTVGTGANRQYVGRAPQDKALLNIFAFLEWGYDEEFERQLATAEFERWQGKDAKTHGRIMKDFYNVRRALEELKSDHILSPRNLLQASRLIATGASPDLIRDSIVMRGLPYDTQEKIKAQLKKLTGPKDHWADHEGLALAQSSTEGEEPNF